MRYIFKPVARHFYFLVLGGLGLLTASACSSDHADEFYEEELCTIESVSFKADIEPILSQSCLYCHSTNSHSAAGGDIDLETFSSLQSYARNGSLLGAIRHQSGYEPMPLGGAKLEACDIEKIRLWAESISQE